MNTSNVKLRWVFAAVLATFPVVGLLCSIVYHDLSMLWVSLIAAAIAAIVFPVTFVLLYLLSTVFSMCVSGIFIFVSEIMRLGKR